MRKRFLFRLEFRRMHASLTAPQLHRIFQMQHLVEKQVLEREAGNDIAIKDPAYDNRIMRRVIMTQAAARGIRAPGELRLAQQSMKVASVQFIENFFQVEAVGVGGRDSFAS